MLSRSSSRAGAPRPWSLSHRGRWLALAAPVALIGAALPAATIHATTDPALPALIAGISDGDEVLLVQDEVVVIDSGPGLAIALRGPTDSALADVRLWLSDGCDIDGRTTAWGVNASGSPVSVRPADAADRLDAGFTIPAGDPGVPFGFVIPDPLSCDVLATTPPARFKTLEGTLFFDGRTNRCGDFQADVAFRQSKQGDDLDRLTLRGSQDNRIISQNPLVTIDGSNAFDEVFLLLADPSADSGAPRLEGVAIGGGTGTAPKLGKLQKRIDRIPSGELAELLRESVDRAEAGQKVAPLLRALGADPRACTYHLELELDDDANLDSVERLAAAASPPLPVVPDDQRFQVQVDWTDPAIGEVERAGLAGVTPADRAPFYFFNDDDWRMLVTIIDGCELSGHYWVFAAATTDVGYTLTVTDSETGESRSYGDPGMPAATVTDTSAFATCP